MKIEELVKNGDQVIEFLIGLTLLGFVFGLGFIILRWLWKTDLSKLISEPDGKASISRLQLLVFTFVIGLSFFFVVVGSSVPQFPTISPEVLMLLGIATTTTLASKALGGPSNSPSAPATPPPPSAPTPPAPTSTSSTTGTTDGAGGQ